MDQKVANPIICFQVSLENFTNKKIKTSPVFINSVKIPYANEAKYLGMTLDAKLNSRAHVKMKTKHLDLQYRKNVLVTWTVL